MVASSPGLSIIVGGPGAPTGSDVMLIVRVGICLASLRHHTIEQLFFLHILDT